MVDSLNNASGVVQPKPQTVKTHTAAKSEEGFLLLAVLFMLAIILLSLAIAAPKMATDLRRDKEIETVHRGMQYARAVRIYYRKFGRYPNTIDQLTRTEGQRFLRKRYIDPMTGKDDWRLIHLGESHLLANSAGQQLAGAAGNLQGASALGGNGTGSAFGASGTGVSSSTPGFGSSGSSFGSSGSNGSGFGSNSNFGSSSDSGNSGTGSSLGGNSSGGSAFGSNGTNSTGGSGNGNSAFGTPGATFGGAPIVGVGLPISKASIKIYKKQSRYNLWEFVYDPNTDLGGAMGQNGTNGTQPGLNNGIGGSNGIGGGSGGIGGNNNGGFTGNSGSTGGSNNGGFTGSQPQ